MLLGPAWAEVVLPFRLFTISLLSRMSNKISEACTKAAGEVYCRTSLQGAFGAIARRPALRRGGSRHRSVDRDGHQLVEHGTRQVVRPNRRESCCNGAPTASLVTEPL